MGLNNRDRPGFKTLQNLLQHLNEHPERLGITAEHLAQARALTPPDPHPTLDHCADFVVLLNALDLSKYRHSTTTVTQQDGKPLITRTLNEGETADEVDEYRLFMIRGLSYAIGTQLVIDHSELDPTEVAARRVAIQRCTAEFILHMHATFRRYPGTLSNRQFRKAKKAYDRLLTDLCYFIPGTSLKQRQRFQERGERYVNWELRTPDYQTVMAIQRDHEIDGRTEQRRYRLTQRSNPIEFITEAQREEWFGETNTAAPATLDNSMFSNNPDQQALWYTQLPPWEQRYLQSKAASFTSTPTAESDDDWSHGLSYAWRKSANERRTPGLANFTGHSFRIEEEQSTADDNEEIAILPRSTSNAIGFSVPSPIQQPKPDERSRLMQQNIEQALEYVGLKDGALTAERAEQFERFWGLTGVASPFPAGSLFRLPISMTGYLTPAPYQPGKNQRFPPDLKPQDNNTLMLEEKAEVIAQIRRGLHVNEEATLQLEPKLYDPNYAINGRRGWIKKAVKNDPYNQADQLIEDLIHNSKLLLQWFYPLADLPTNTLPAEFSENQKSIQKIHGLFPIVDLKNFTQTSDTREGLRLIVNAIKTSPQYQSAHAEHLQRLCLLLTALHNYIYLLYGNYNTTKHNKSLFLASLHRLLIDNMGGIVTAHCKSSKDRFGLVDLHVHAMEISYHCDGFLPAYTDQDEPRARFAENFATLYRGYHTLEQANLNNRGSCGLKDETAYWPISWLTGSRRATYMLPKDLKAAIGPHRVKQSKRVASFNKPTVVKHRKLKMALALLGGLGFAAACPFVFPLLGATLGLMIFGGIIGGLVGATYAKLTGRSVAGKILTGALIGVLVCGLATAIPAILLQLPLPAHTLAGLHHFFHGVREILHAGLHLSRSLLSFVGMGIALGVAAVATVFASSKASDMYSDQKSVKRLSDDLTAFRTQPNRYACGSYHRLMTEDSLGDEGNNAATDEDLTADPSDGYSSTGSDGFGPFDGARGRAGSLAPLPRSLPSDPKITPTC